jgi:hypothetical protein
VEGGLRLEELDLGCFATSFGGSHTPAYDSRRLLSGNHPHRLAVLLSFDIELLCLFISRDTT